jgi:hypothetical protein
MVVWFSLFVVMHNRMTRGTSDRRGHVSVEKVEINRSCCQQRTQHNVESDDERPFSEGQDHSLNHGLLTP